MCPEVFSPMLGFCLAGTAPLHFYQTGSGKTSHITQLPKHVFRQKATAKTAFLRPWSLQTESSQCKDCGRLKIVTCQLPEDDVESAKQPSNPSTRQSKHKFDPDSQTDAFGRDPKKETEFWMGAAKSVLDSDEVREAIEKHKAEGGDGLTDEQRAYMEFIKSMDSKPSEQG